MFGASQRTRRWQGLQVAGRRWQQDRVRLLYSSTPRCTGTHPRRVCSFLRHRPVHRQRLRLHRYHPCHFRIKCNIHYKHAITTWTRRRRTCLGMIQTRSWRNGAGSWGWIPRPRPSEARQRQIHPSFARQSQKRLGRALMQAMRSNLSGRPLIRKLRARMLLLRQFRLARL